MRAVRALYDVPRIALTGYVTDEDEQRCAAASFIGFLRRPVTFGGMMDAVAAAVRPR